MFEAHFREKTTRGAFWRGHVFPSYLGNINAHRGRECQWKPPPPLSEVANHFSMGCARVLHSTASGAYDRRVLFYTKNCPELFRQKSCCGHATNPFLKLHATFTPWKAWTSKWICIERGARQDNAQMCLTVFTVVRLLLEARAQLAKNKQYFEQFVWKLECSQNEPFNLKNMALPNWNPTSGKL